MVTLDEIRAAQRRIHGLAVHTPLIGCFSHQCPGQIYIKAESLQPIGAFKLRGAANKIAQLSRHELRRGVITYSSGNHAQGVAYAARAFGSKAVIVMPSNAPEIKRRATADLGAEIVTVGNASSERKSKAEELAAQHGYVVIPPYDDPDIITGQATCGLEILKDLPNVDLVLAPVSGGGLLGGVAAAIKQLRPQCRVIGVEPELAADAHQSFHAGRIVSWPAEKTSRTIADGLRTQSLGQLNYELIRACVDDIITVSEEEIRTAMRRILLDARLTAEPSGAVTSAALLFHTSQLPPYRRAVPILSGGNVEPALLAQILSQES